MGGKMASNETTSSKNPKARPCFPFSPNPRICRHKSDIGYVTHHDCDLRTPSSWVPRFLAMIENERAVILTQLNALREHNDIEGAIRRLIHIGELTDGYMRSYAPCRTARRSRP